MITHTLILRSPVDNKNIRTIKLSNESHFSQQFNGLPNFLNLNPYDNFREVMAKTAPFMSYNLDPRVHNVIKGLIDGKDDALLIEGLPVSLFGLPHTPCTDRKPEKKDYLSEYILLGLSSLLQSTPLINKHEKDGSIIQQVIPISGKENEQSGLGSRTAFDLHTENIHEFNPPHFFMLLCLKGDKNAMTTYIPVERVLNDLPYWLVKELLQPQFIAKTGPSYNKIQELRTSVLSSNKQGDLNIRFNSDPGRMYGINTSSEKVLTVFRKHLSEIQPNLINLKTGDCLIINNHKALHGRTAFEVSTTNENRRWLQRIYLYNDSMQKVFQEISNQN